MRTTSAPFRSIGLSATAVLALVALAAAVPTDSLRAVVGPPTRAMQGQGSAVRFVAAAVAAAARELARVDQQGCAVAALAVQAALPFPAPLARDAQAPGRAPDCTLIELLLDLPPPIC